MSVSPPQKRSSRLLSSSLKMASATTLSRLLGLLREQLMAAFFGASAATDAFAVAYRIPNMLRDLFAEGVLSSAFVPLFVEAKAKDGEKARRLLWSLFVLLAFGTGLVALAMIIFAPELVSFATSESFMSDPERGPVAIQLLRITAPFLVLVSLAALFMGALNALKVFFIPSLSPVFFNLVMILSILFLPSWLEKQGMKGVFALAFGVLMGGALQAIIQVPLLLKKHYKPTWRISLWGREIKSIVGRLGFGTFGVMAHQINILITTILATGITSGGLSCLIYAFRLFQFPIGVISVSLAGSNLVYFSDCWKKGEKKEAVETLGTSYFLSCMALFPALALLYVLSEETVRLVFERGAFNATNTAQTAMAFRWYLLGLPFYGLYKVFSPTFFALDLPKIPVLISLVSVAFNITFCVFLVPLYGLLILALGPSLSMGLNASLQAIFLKNKLALPPSFFFNGKILKITLAAIASGMASHKAKGLFTPLLLDTFSCLLLGASIYFFSLILLGEGQTLKKLFPFSLTKPIPSEEN